MSAKVQDIIANGDLNTSVLDDMPEVHNNMTTGEWVVMKCHPDTMLACAEMKGGCTYEGK